jgi:hypothetical protein
VRHRWWHRWRYGGSGGQDSETARLNRPIYAAAPSRRPEDRRSPSGTRTTPITASCRSRRNRYPDRRTLSTPAACANRGRESRHRTARRVVPGPAPLGVGSPDTRRSGVVPLSPRCRASSVDLAAISPAASSFHGSQRRAGSISPALTSEAARDDGGRKTHRG